MHAIRRDHTSPAGFPAAPTASGMPGVMTGKQLGQWDHVERASCPLVIVKRCSGPALDRLRTEAQMGENGGRTTGQLLSHGPCACLAWCLMSLAHIQCAGTAGLAVSDDGDGPCIKIPFLQGCYTKGYRAANARGAKTYGRYTSIARAMPSADRTENRIGRRRDALRA